MSELYAKLSQSLPDHLSLSTSLVCPAFFITNFETPRVGPLWIIHEVLRASTLAYGNDHTTKDCHRM